MLLYYLKEQKKGKWKLIINNLVTDKCSAISPRLLHFFPNAEQVFDPGHRGKSLEKKIQSLSSTYKGLRGFASKVKAHYLTTIRLYKGKPLLWKNAFLEGFDHWIGTCSKFEWCHEPTKTVDDIPSQQALAEVMNE